MEKILIVDDSPIEARIASKFLTGAGYSTAIIHNGEEALDIARQLRPDLILLDVTMPKIDGYQVCRQLKADPETRGIATALYTIRDELVDWLKGIEAGADDFVVKTLKGEDFLSSVRKILREHRVGAFGPAESLNLNLITPLARVLNRQELVQLLYGTFNKHVREAASVMLGAHVAGFLIDRAIERAAIQFPYFRGRNQLHLSSLLLDSQVIQETPIMDLIVGFQTFSNELYQLVNKLARVRFNGAKEARAVGKAFVDMIRELHLKYEDMAAHASKMVPSIEAPPALDRGPQVEPTPQPLKFDCAIDVSGALVQCSEDLVRVVGYSKSELIGLAISTLLTHESHQALNRACDRLVEKGAAQVRLQLKTKDDALIHANARLAALYDSQGHFALIRCGFEIIPMERLLQERDQEIGTLKRALGDFHQEFDLLASTISHDLRQPLHAMLMLCQFLVKEHSNQLDESAQSYLQSIEQAGLKMKKLVEDLVRYARMSGRSQAGDEVDLNQLMDGVREELSSTLIERGAILQVMGQLPTIVGDRERLTEVLMELITNALKFNNNVQPVVEIGRLKEDAEAYTFYVKDNGIGIEEPYYESIFRLFHRLHTSEEYDGTGTGLAVCRKIVESHGGRMWVTSRLGAGTTFFFTLPRDIPSLKYAPSLNS
jgi:PAS domain S-box-containing protein